MIIAHSLWTHPKPPTRDSLRLQALSVIMAKRLYPKVVLHTDTLGAAIVRRLKLPYDEVHLTLNEIPAEIPKSYWAFGKLVAYKALSKAGVPWAHIDNDVFLFEPLPKSFDTSPVFAQNVETYQYYRDTIRCLPADVISDAALPMNEWAAYNAGVLGGNDTKFLEDYADRAMSIARRLIGYGINGPDWGPNILFEQAFLARHCRDHGRAVATITSAGYGPQADRQAAEAGFAHVITRKNSPVTLRKCFLKLSQVSNYHLKRIGRCSLDLSPLGKVYHVRDMCGWTDPRILRAQQSWERMYSEGAVPVTYDSAREGARKFSATLPLPYLKDVLQAGLDASSAPGDVLIFTNQDTLLTPGFHAAIRRRMRYADYCCAHRSCFYAGQPWGFGAEGHLDGGRDMFAFRRSWLAGHFDQIPDFLLGVGGWDPSFAIWWRHQHGSDLVSGPGETPLVEISHKFIWHEAHPTPWILESDEWTAARRYNLTTADAFLHGIGSPVSLVREFEENLGIRKLRERRVVEGEKKS